MNTLPHILARATYRDIKNGSYDVALLPWGATEAHNYHLPYGTDNFESDAIAAEAARLASARGAKVIALPSVPFGVNTGQLDIPLTINLNPSTQMRLLDDVASSLEQQGIPKLVIVNSHGGNDFRQMIRELQPHHTIFLCTTNWFKSVDLKLYFDQPGDHADEMETSLMMHIAPDVVLPLTEAGTGSERKIKIRAFREGWAWTPRQWTKVSHDTGVGNPTLASAAKGKKFFEAVTGKLAAFLVELAAADLSDLYEGDPSGT